MTLATGEARRLGRESDSRLQFGEDARPESAWRGRRLLLLDDRAAFGLSFWCGTCPFLFERLEGANDKLSLSDLADRLAQGIDRIDDDVLRAYSALLPLGLYVPLLLEVQPRLVRPLGAGDYFSGEQVATWGIDAFWGLPEYPHTPYYRTFETPVESAAHLYEFVVPMVPPSWNDPARVTHFAELLKGPSAPTAVAVATLDVCAPALDNGADWSTHWGLTHFLLDGHHKFQAAAESDRSLRLLSLLSVEASLASVGEVERVPALRRGPRAGRTMRG